MSRMVPPLPPAVFALAVALLTAPALLAQTTPLARADVNRDCAITRTDATIVQALIGRRVGQSGVNPNADVVQDGVINNADVTFVSRNIGKTACAPVNRAPAITSAPATGATLLEPYAYPVTAADPDGDAMTFSLPTAPPGMSIDQASGLVRWTPPTTGPLDVVVRASDGRGGVTTQAFVLNVTRPQNRPPVLTPLADREIVAGAPFRLRLSAHDPDPGDVLAFSLPGAPAGVLLASGAVVTWTPGAGDIGDHRIPVRVQDAAGASDTGSVSLRVLPVSGAPRFDPQPDASITAGTAFARDVAAVDPDAGDVVTHALVAGPAGLSASNTGQLAWTPSLAQLGRHDVKVKATDSTGLSAVAAFSITVDVPESAQPPIARDDRYAVRRQSALVVAAPGVLENDNDPSARPLSAQLMTPPAKGAAVLSADGALSYVLPPAAANSTTPQLAYGISHSDAGGILVASYLQPMVADLDGDGSSEIVFLALGAFADRRLIAVHGATGQKAWVTNAYQPTGDTPLKVCVTFCQLAAGDLDADGRVEILAVHSDDETSALRRRVVAFNFDGTLRWKSDDIVDGTNVTQTSGLMWLNLADLDGDGAPEIVALHQGKTPATPPAVITEDIVTVFDRNGHIRWSRRVPGTPSGRDLAVADVDLDGSPDLVIGGAVLNAAGQLKWSVKPALTGIAYVAVGNLDDDPYAEIVYGDNFANLSVYEHTGAKKWGPVKQPIFSDYGPPTIADVDGDGRAEVLRGGDGVEVWDRHGNLERTMALPAPFLGYGGNPVVFDLNGDGIQEVIYNGATGPHDTGFVRGALYIFDGPSGTLLHSLPASRNSGDGGDNSGPVVADVTGDGSAEIVTGGWNEQTVLRVFRAAAGRWADTRPIWNQMSYHVTNVLADGRIPAHEPVHWLTPGLNTYRMNVPLPEERTADGDALTYVAGNGVATSNVASVRIDILPPNAAPRILSTAPVAAAPEIEYVYGVRAVDPDPGETLGFSLPIAPAGMTIDAAGVIRWTPAANATGSALAVVRVVDSQSESDSQQFTITIGDPVQVPNVVGQSSASARDTLAAAGLAVGTEARSPSPTVPVGQVISQLPDVGVTVAAGATVDLVASSGPAPVTMPHLVGRSENDALNHLAALGLPASPTRAYSNVVARGTVMAQEPAAGTVVAPGAVTVTVSVGPGLALRLRRTITTADQPIPLTAVAYDRAYAELAPPVLTFSVAPLISPYFGTLPTVSGGQVVPALDTRGAFRVTATDAATGRSASADFAVTVPRTAGQASMTDAYGDVSEAIGDIHRLAFQARAALTLGDAGTIRTLLDQMVRRWRSVDTFRLRFATPFGLSEGFMPTAAELPALGLTPTPDDLLAGQVLKDAADDLRAWIDGLREPSTSMATLEQLAGRFNSRADRLQRLTMSEWGGIRHAPAMTVFVSQLLPEFYDALIGELEQVVANSAGGPGPSTLAEQLVVIAVNYVIEEIAETPLHEFRESVMKQAAWTASAVAAAHHFRTRNQAGPATAIVAGASLSVHVFEAHWSFVEGEFDYTQPGNAVVVMLGPQAESKLSMPLDSVTGAISAAGNAFVLYHTLNQIYTSLRQGISPPADALGLASTAFQLPQEGYAGCVFSSLPTCSQLVFPGGFASVYQYSPPDEFGKDFIGLPVPILTMIYDKSSGRVTIDTPVFLPTPKAP